MENALHLWCQSSERGRGDGAWFQLRGREFGVFDFLTEDVRKRKKGVKDILFLGRLPPQGYYRQHFITLPTTSCFSRVHHHWV